MRRRDLLKAARASLAAVAAPRIGRAEKANLVFVPALDLSLLDPVVTGNRSTRTHAYLVFDTVYGIDTNWMAQPQMVEGHRGYRRPPTPREIFGLAGRSSILSVEFHSPPGGAGAGGSMERDDNGF
jgi:hypothetical protein